jgi:putative transposase
MLFSSERAGRPGLKVPKEELIDVVVAMKRRNPNWGCPRIAQQIVLAFGVEIDKDMVRRIRRAHYQPDPDSQGPSWLTFLGHMKDSLWSCDLFRCESATLRTYWVLLAPIFSVLCLNKFPKAPASWRAPRLGFPHPLL